MEDIPKEMANNYEVYNLAFEDYNYDQQQSNDKIYLIPDPLDDNQKIRSAAGVALDLMTPIGPLNFSLSQAISKTSTDVTESFRFNLGTTF